MIFIVKSNMTYGITTLNKRGNTEDVYYYVNWSPLTKADRWEINAKVPSIAGIYEIYWMDETKKLRMFHVGRTHYGGLRSELRRLIDADLTIDPIVKDILENKEIWYRYAPSNSSQNMADVIWFFMSTYFPEKTDINHSGRYRKIFLQESEPDKLLWVP